MSSGKANNGITLAQWARQDLLMQGRARVPLLRKQLYIQLSFGLRAGPVDRFEISGDLFHMFVRHIAQRVSYEMHQAKLHPCLRINRLNS